MEITNEKVYGLEESIVTSGYPMLNEPMDEVEFENRVNDVIETIARHYSGEYIENRDVKRAIKLAQAPSGSGHDNYLKGIIVQMDVNAPQYFWQQLQRYHFIDFVSSMSKMHCITKFDGDNMLNEAVDSDTYDNMLLKIERFKHNECDIDTLLMNVPMGLEYTARMTTNYLQLKTIYKQRRNHRSQQWQVFCDWIETLPMAKELIYAKKTL